MNPHTSAAGPHDNRWLVSSLMSQGAMFRQRYFWHSSNDRYVLFVAEFFLRRTNRTTVERNLPAFIERFPDADSLIESSGEETVDVARWAGLRSRTMRLPEVTRLFMERSYWTAEQLLDLPYIGEYAAHALTLYIFNQPSFPIDNNVNRVLTRYLDLETESEKAAAVTRLREYTCSLHGVNGLKLVHMGLLALGWDHCRSSAKCTDCPLRGLCAYNDQPLGAARG